MAASEETCDQNPNFAIICSFITKFGDDCGVNIPIPDLQQMLEDTKNVHKDLEELLIHLMRRGRKRVNKERWEKCIIKFCHEYSSVDAWEVERFGFLKSKLSVKLELLKRLLELQFDANAKFKAEVNKLDASSLRILPLGRDIDGQAYWYQLDRDYNMRLYRETMGEDGAWQLVCSTTDDIRVLLANLEKKYSSGETCESKSSDSNNPKSPSSDTPVPKKENDSEDLTSCSLSETKPCTIIIKTEKRDSLAHSEMSNCVKNENCAIVKDASKKPESKESENSTKGSVKLKLKLEPSIHSKTEQKSDKSVVEVSPVVEKNAISVLDSEPMEVEITEAKETDAVLLSKSVSSTDSEMKDVENLSVDKSKSEEQSDQKISTNSNNSAVHTEKSDSVNHHKSSKIKLYEKWSNEKKKTDANQISTEECSVGSKMPSLPEGKELCELATSNQKDDPAIPLKCLKEQSVNLETANIPEKLDDQSSNADVETAVDLSKSSRVHVIVQNTCSKPALSNGVPVKSCDEEKLENDAGISDINSKKTESLKKHDSSVMSVFEKSSKSSSKSYQSHEAESKKLKKLNKMYSDCYDSSVITSTNSGSGLSHLQALQNMCESNAMGGIPSVIHSTNHRNVESNRTVISENKTVISDSVNFDTMGRKYNFNEVQCSNDKINDPKTTDILLKSNVQKDMDLKKDKKESENNELKDSRDSSLMEKGSCNKSSELLATDLSCSSDNKSSKNGLKSSLNEDSAKANTSEIIEKNSSALKGVIKIGIKETVKSEDNCNVDKKDHSKVSKISPETKMECDPPEEKVTNTHNSMQTHSETVVKDVKEKSCDIGNCLEKQNTEKCLNSAVKSNCKSDTSCKPLDSENLRIESFSGFAEKDLSKTESTTTESCSSPDKPTNESTQGPNSDTPNLLKESKAEIITDKNESSKSTNGILPACEDIPLVESTDSDCLPSLKSNLKLTENDASKKSPVKLVSEDRDKASADIVTVDTFDKDQNTVVNKPKSNDILTTNAKKPSSENDSHKNISIELHLSEESSVTNNKTVQCEKRMKSDNPINTKEELNISNKKVSVEGNGNSYIADNSHAPELVPKKSDKESKIEQEHLKIEKEKESKIEKEKESKIEKEKESKIEKKKELKMEIDKESKVETEEDLKIEKEKESKIEKEKESKIEKVKDSKIEKEKESKIEKVKDAKIEKEKESKIEKIKGSKSGKKDSKFGKEKESKSDMGKDSKIEKEKESKSEMGKDSKIEKEKEHKNENKDSEIEKEKESKSETGKDCDIEKEKEHKNENKDSEIEKVKDSDIEKEKDSDIEKEKDSKIEKEKGSKIEKEGSKIEKVKDSKIEKVKDSKIEKVKDSDIEKEKDSKIEKVKDSKIEKEKGSKIEKEDSEIEKEKDSKTETEEPNIKKKQDSKIEKVKDSKIKKNKESKIEIDNDCKNENDVESKTENKGAKQDCIKTAESGENKAVDDSKLTEDGMKTLGSNAKDSVSEKTDCDDECKKFDKTVSENKSPGTEKDRSKEENKECSSKSGDKDVSGVSVKDNEQPMDISANTSPKLNKTDSVALSDNDLKNKKSEDHEALPEENNNSKAKLSDFKLDYSEELVIEEDKNITKNDSKIKSGSKSKTARKKTSKKTPVRKNTRFAKSSHVENLDAEVDCLNVSKEQKEPPKKDLVESKISEESVTSNIEKKVNESSKNEIKSKIMLLAEQFKIYNLRHSRCLETKFKHPSFDKYVRKSVDPNVAPPEIPMELIIEEQPSNVIPTPNTKTRARGKNVKQPVEKKPQPAAKKTPAPNSKKRPSRSRKKEDVKDDFSIPEGFLEILGNAEKAASEKAAAGKKRKGSESKEAPGSQQSSDNESTPIKRSRRIQEQHKKKMSELAVEMEREQRMLEQMAKRSAKSNKPATPQKSPAKPNGKGPNTKNSNAKVSSTPTKSPKTKSKIVDISTEEDTCMESTRRTTRKMNSRSKNLTKMTLLYEDESKDSQFSTSRETEKSKKRRRRRGQKKGFKPWDVSSESSSSVEEITDEEEEEEPEEILIFDANEDEFACEEVDPNAEPVVIRRARTAKKIEVVNAAEECINDDTPCQKCGKYDKPEWILLCDKCDNGYHTHCLMPPLMIVPDGDWFCQPCEHMALCQCLHEELSKLEVILKQKEREALRKQRLAYVGISLDNVLKPEKKEKSDESSKDEEGEEDEEEEEETEKEQENRRPQKHKESFEDERHQKLYGKRSVRARRNVNYQFKEYDELIFSALQEDMIEVPEEFKEDVSEAGSDKPFTAKISKKKKRGRRWKDFDSSDDDSGEEYQGGSTDSEATAPPSSRSDQESGSGEWKIVKSRKKPQRKSRSRRSRRDNSSEEDWEDEVVDNTYRPTTRRAAQKAVSYREISSEEEDEWGAAKRHVSKKRRKVSSSDGSEASFKRKTSKKKRVRRWEGSDSSEESEEKSMSSSGKSEEEEDESQEEESENEFKIDRKDKMRPKPNPNKVLSSDEEEGESSTQDSAPKKKVKKFVSEESEDDEEEEEDEEESESEENSEDEDEEEEDEDDDEVENKTEKQYVVPEKKAPPPTKTLSDINAENKPDAEKNIACENLESATDKRAVSIDMETSLTINENKEFQPKVLVKKELCSVDIPLEPPTKQPVTFTAVSEKAPIKTVRKETTKMVPCVIPYDKSPKSGHASNPEEESDEVSKEEEMPHPVPPNRPMKFPKHGATFTPPPSRIQFGGVLARHSVPPLTSAVRPPMPPSNLQSRFLAPTNLSTRPPVPPSSVVVRHHAPPSRLPARPPVPASNMTVPPSAPPKTTPPLQTTQNKSESKPYKSTIMEPFSNMDDENESDDEVPLERIPTACVPAPLPNRPVSYEREAEYRPAAKELSTFSYAPPEEKPFPSSYSPLASFQDYSARPSPLKPSLVETYPNNSSPSKLTPLDNYSQTSSPKGFISLDSYSENRKKKHFYGNTSSQETESPHRPASSSSENYQGGEIRFPPEPYPCPQSPNTYSHRSPPSNQRDPGTPPRLYSQFPDAYAPPRSPEYYQNHQYYASEERIPRPSYQPNYAPQEPSFVTNPYVATPVPQPNGGFMIDTLLRARNHEEGEDELTGVTDIVSYITQE